MSVIYPTPSKTARMNAIVTLIGSGGKLKLFTAADALVATFTLGNPAGTVSGDTLTFSDANGATDGILDTTASAAGVVAKATITTSDDVVVISGLTVGTSATDMIINNTNVASGQAITLTSASIQHA